jgi:hypothetical protein
VRVIPGSKFSWLTHHLSNLKSQISQLTGGEAQAFRIREPRVNDINSAGVPTNLKPGNLIYAPVVLP